MDSSFLNVDRVIAFLSILFGFWISRHYYKKSLVNKVIGFNSTGPIRLSTSKDVSVSLDGILYEYLEKRYYLLWNKGSSAIENADFVSDIYFDAKKFNSKIDGIDEVDSKILVKVDILTKDSLVDISRSEDNIGFRINLIRPGEAVVFRTYCTQRGYRPSVILSTKVKEMVRAEWFSDELLRYVLSVLAGIVAFSAIGAGVVDFFPFDPESIKYVDENFGSVTKALFGLSALAVIVFIILSSSFIANYILKKIIRKNKSSIVVNFAKIMIRSVAIKGSELWKYYDELDVI